MAGSAVVRSGGPLIFLERLRPYLRPSAEVRDEEGIPTAAIRNRTAGLEANARYFSDSRWAEQWLAAMHRYPALRDRWIVAAGSWDGKIVVDVGCGPGNLYATMGGSPAMLIGVDVARGSLQLASKSGYVPLLADAQEMPLRSGFADIVALNGTIHHCENMRRALLESARLVKVGGVIIIDHDPHQSAWRLRGPGLFLWKVSRPVARWMQRQRGTATAEQQQLAEAARLHHQPGEGLTEQMLCSILDPLGFETHIYPHNHQAGREVMQGHMGRAKWSFRVGQRLSGIHTRSHEAALSLLCVAKRIC